VRGADPKDVEVVVVEDKKKSGIIKARICVRFKENKAKDEVQGESEKGHGQTSDEKSDG